MGVTAFEQPSISIVGHAARRLVWKRALASFLEAGDVDGYAGADWRQCRQ